MSGENVNESVPLIVQSNEKMVLPLTRLFYFQQLTDITFTDTLHNCFKQAVNNKQVFFATKPEWKKQTKGLVSRFHFILSEPISLSQSCHSSAYKYMDVNSLRNNNIHTMPAVSFSFSHSRL